MKKDIIIIITVSLFLLIGIHVTLMRTEQNKTHKTETFLSDTVSNSFTIVKEYGFPVDSFNIIYGRVRWSESLYVILRKYGVSPIIIDELAKKAKGVFDLSKIKTRNKYLLLRSNDSIKTPKYFIYVSSLTEYVVFGLSDSISVNNYEIKIDTIRKSASAEIKSSLWNAMVDNSLHPVLANELSEIYAWSIDFFRLQKNDKFTIIYDEEFVDTLSVGVGKIYAVVFNHIGTNYYAFLFEQDSVESYYDEKGNSLRKTFLKAPLRYNRISSRFTYSRFHPILKIRRPHTGVDYAAPTGTPVHSIGDGVVIHKKYTKGAGRTVKIKHNSVYTTAYNHFSRFAKGLKVGDYVKQGQIIGYVGKSGYATGPHLDFRVWENGKPMDPLKLKAPPVKPIKEENKLEFEQVKNYWLKQLDNVK